ncbi:MAG: sugar transferase [Terriglobales bacterium]|jgi:exopolysaccharide biosynthesis polyprenyl glycosylphosphotransferase
MGELTTNQLWNTGKEDFPSQYARMIPGTSAMPRAKVLTDKSAPDAEIPRRPVSVTDEKTARSTQTRMPIQELLPHPTGDRFMVFQLVAADLLVLAAVCSLPALFNPAWGLPWASLPIFAVLVTLFGFSEGLYKNAGDPYPAGIVPILARSTLFAVGLVLSTRWDGVRPLAAFTAFTASLTGLVVWRRLKRTLSHRRRRETESRKTLIVGGGPMARSIAQALRNDPLHRANVCGFVDDDLPLSPVVLGRIADLDWLARAEFIDEVILALPGQVTRAREAAEIAFRNHLDIRAVPDLPPGPWSDCGIDHIGEVPVVTLHRESWPDATLFLKRLLDITGAACGLVLVSPLLAIVALLIRLDSPGPVVYSAERTGARGRRFRCFKFRSMVTNADHLKEDLRARNQREGPIFKIDDDPRVTRIGRILRRYSLDELPQLWNVLRGEMSLVGPRPHPVDEVKQYELHHYRRLDVKPGITGLWQITARDCPSFELNMHLDLTYIENWSLRLDLRILASTVRVLFAPEGV